MRLLRALSRPLIALLAPRRLTLPPAPPNYPKPRRGAVSAVRGLLAIGTSPCTRTRAMFASGTASVSPLRGQRRSAALHVLVSSIAILSSSRSPDILISLLMRTMRKEKACGLPLRTPRSSSATPTKPSLHWRQPMPAQRTEARRLPRARSQGCLSGEQALRASREGSIAQSDRALAS